jgi:hypothetical protein
MSQEISNIVDNSPFVQKLDKLLAIDCWGDKIARRQT